MSSLLFLILIGTSGLTGVTKIPPGGGNSAPVKCDEAEIARIRAGIDSLEQLGTTTPGLDLQRLADFRDALLKASSGLVSQCQSRLVEGRGAAGSATSYIRETARKKAETAVDHDSYAGVRDVSYGKSTEADSIAETKAGLGALDVPPAEASRLVTDSRARAAAGFSRDRATTEAITAEQCGTITPPPHLPPIRHQGDSGWCARFVAADLLSVRLGKSVSPASIAVGGHLAAVKEGKGDAEVRAAFAEGRSIQDSLRDAIKNGHCDERDMLSTSPFPLADGETTNMYREIARLRRTPGAGPESKSCAKLDSTLNYLFPGQTESVAGVLAAQAEKSTDMLRTLFEKCRKDTPVQESQIETKIFSRTDGIDGKISLLNQRLAEGKAVGLVIPIGLLSGPAEFYRGKNGGQHAVSVVGRKWDPTSGTCRYQVRNSYGLKNEKKLDASTFPNDGGTVWVDAFRLMDFAQTIVTVR